MSVYKPNKMSCSIDVLIQALAYESEIGASFEAGDLCAWNANHKVTLLTDTAGLRAAGMCADLKADNSQSAVPGNYQNQSGLVRVHQGPIACMVMVPDGVEPAPLSRLFAYDRHTLALNPNDTANKVETPYLLLNESTENDNHPNADHKIYNVIYAHALAMTAIAVV